MKTYKFDFFKISDYDELGFIYDYDFGSFNSLGAARKELARLAKIHGWDIAQSPYDEGMFIAKYYQPADWVQYPCLLSINYL